MSSIVCERSENIKNRQEIIVCDENSLETSAYLLKPYISTKVDTRDSSHVGPWHNVVICIIKTCINREKINKLGLFL